jgi:hypothetical protein
MAIEAPISKYRKNNLKIYIVICIIAAIWFGYDGYLNKDFRQEHTDPSGKADTTLIINRIAPPLLILTAGLFGVYLIAIRKKKIIAGDRELFVPSSPLRVDSGKEKIAYEDIQKIDKTYFDKKGFFVITYRGSSGNEIERKLSHRQYDNLTAILDHLVAKIT